MNAKRMTPEQLKFYNQEDKMIKEINKNKEKYGKYMKILDLCVKYDCFEAEKGLVKDFWDKNNK